MPFSITVLVSTLLGFLSGLGIGGGSLMILWLSMVCGFDYPTAKYVNLLFFLAPASIAVIIHIVKGRISLARIWPAILSGCLCAIILTIISSSWDVGLLRKAFGALLLVTAFRELTYQESKQQNASHS